MSAKIIDGNSIAAQIQEEVAQEVQRLKQTQVHPCLAVVAVRKEGVSECYVGNKGQVCEAAGIRFLKIEVAAGAPEQALLDEVDKLNQDPHVHGILLQLPIPHSMNQERIVGRISPSKDVDGFHPENIGKLIMGLDCLAPCTASGIPELITRSGIGTAGKHAVIVGRSNLVGKPVMNLLMRKGDKANCTVTCCHSGTDHLANHTRQADILIAAIGVPHFVTAGMVKEGATVIDVGINRLDDLEHSLGYRLVGDVDFDEVREVAGNITPVPGGVGPITLAMMIRNTVKAARLQTSV